MYLDVQIYYRVLFSDDSVYKCVNLGGFLHLACHCMKRWGFLTMCVCPTFWSVFFLKLLQELIFVI